MSSTQPNAVGFPSRLAGLVLGCCSAAPALAAGFEPAVAPRELLLFAALVLLVVALAMRLTRRRDLSGSAPAGPDLRWWKNPDA